MTDLEKYLSDLVDKAVADAARQTSAINDKAKVEAELLSRVVTLVKPALPFIAPTIKGSDRRGIELIGGKPETLLFEDGTLAQPAEKIVRENSVRLMLQRLATLLEKQGRGRSADKAEADAHRVREILRMLNQKL